MLNNLYSELCFLYANQRFTPNSSFALKIRHTCWVITKQWTRFLVPSYRKLKSKAATFNSHQMLCVSVRSNKTEMKIKNIFAKPPPQHLDFYRKRIAVESRNKKCKSCFSSSDQRQQHRKTENQQPWPKTKEVKHVSVSH